jgi:hypothetical protein
MLSPLQRYWRKHRGSRFPTGLPDHHRWYLASSRKRHVGVSSAFCSQLPRVVCSPQADHVTTRVAENNTLILVGCMPAFAHFVRQVKDNISTRMSRSKLRGSSKDSNPAWETQPPLPYSDGRADMSGRKLQRHHYDPSDTILLETRVSVGPDAPEHVAVSTMGEGLQKPPGIVRTTKFHQESKPGGGPRWSQSDEELL